MRDTNGSKPRWRFRSCLMVAVVLVGALTVVMVWLWPARPAGSLAELPLADGRIFLIEAVTYGTNHVVGRDSTLFRRIAPLLPRRLAQKLQPRDSRNVIETPHPSLVVWVNALKAVTRTNVDCQAVRVELGGDGEWFGSYSPHWFGGTRFWRVGHEFSVYPRHLTNLTVRITPWRTNVTAETVIPNPAPATPQSWTGLPVPQEAVRRGFTLRLSGLTLRTNYARPRYFQTATPFWDPVWEVLKDGVPANGWQEPVWRAEDPWGNHGIHLGVRSSVLRYSVICYPSSTNEEVAELLVALAPVDFRALTSNVVANQTFSSPKGEVRFVGLFPPSGRSAYAFSEGEYDPAVPMGGVMGGAPSGWTGSGGFVNPFQEKWHHGHYTPWPTFYLHANLTNTAARIGVRLRDDRGNLVATRMEPQGERTGIWPYLASNVTNLTVVIPEIVLLRPLEATFDVDTTLLSREPAPAGPDEERQEPAETTVDLFN